MSPRFGPTPRTGCYTPLPALSNTTTTTTQLSYFVLLQLDEFQDVAHSQYRLLRALTCGSRQCVTVVGDGDQAIYDWRGADVLLFEVCCPASPPHLPLPLHPPLPVPPSLPSLSLPEPFPSPLPAQTPPRLPFQGLCHAQASCMGSI